MNVFTIFKQRLVISPKKILAPLLMICLGGVSYSAAAYFRLEVIGTYPNYTGVRVTGNTNDIPFASSGSAQNQNRIYWMPPFPNGGLTASHTDIRILFQNGSHVSFSDSKSGISCPLTQAATRAFIDNYMNGLFVPYSNHYDAGVSPVSRIQLDYWCSSVHQTMAYGVEMFLNTPESDIEVINPPAIDSVCKLNNQNLSYSYSSSNLNVDGLSQSRNVTVSCTTGTAKNYQLRLTGSNVVSGRLNFGNGVSAQISLNGTPVSANGGGISLSSLTSRSLPVNAALVGTASSSGVTNANGVLVLDAL